jgi:molybdopterin converting factor small subunit
MPRHEVLLFAGAAQLTARDSLDVEVAEPVTAQAVLTAIGQRAPELASLLPACRLAVDQVFVTPDFPIAAGAQLALIPPVSGG